MAICTVGPYAVRAAPEGISVLLLSDGTPIPRFLRRDPYLSTKADGDYEGEYSINPPPGVMVQQKYVKVRVSVNTGRYDGILVTDPRGLKDSKRIVEARKQILAEQTLKVDAVSGATSWTAKAFLKAIENAMQ